MTHTRRQLVELFEQHGLSPSRALGQNFVVDPNTVRRIARLADVGEGDHVLEIGAGAGSLTLALAETGAAIVAVEIDRHLVPLLRSVAEPAGVAVVEGDALSLDWPVVLSGAPRWTLVANLPYNVATPLVLDLLDEVPAIERMLVMVQREAGERLAATAGEPAYGIPSVKVGYWATARVVKVEVSPGCSYPDHRVESVLVAIAAGARRPRPPIPAGCSSWSAQASATPQMLRRSLAEKPGRARGPSGLGVRVCREGAFGRGLGPLGAGRS